MWLIPFICFDTHQCISIILSVQYIHVYMYTCIQIDPSLTCFKLIYSISYLRLLDEGTLRDAFDSFDSICPNIYTSVYHLLLYHWSCFSSLQLREHHLQTRHQKPDQNEEHICLTFLQRVTYKYVVEDFNSLITFLSV